MRLSHFLIRYRPWEVEQFALWFLRKIANFQCALQVSQHNLDTNQSRFIVKGVIVRTCVKKEIIDDETHPLHLKIAHLHFSRHFVKTFMLHL